MRCAVCVCVAGGGVQSLEVHPLSKASQQCNDSHRGKTDRLENTQSKYSTKATTDHHILFMCQKQLRYEAF